MIPTDCILVYHEKCILCPVGCWIWNGGDVEIMVDAFAEYVEQDWAEEGFQASVDGFDKVRTPAGS